MRFRYPLRAHERVFDPSFRCCLSRVESRADDTLGVDHERRGGGIRPASSPKRRIVRSHHAPADWIEIRVFLSQPSNPPAASAADKHNDGAHAD